ncbi:MAG: DMT family transporter [Deltaproteobacteria bacterium]|nr:DMT family transporter [Deltaproteobacteria bacterium]MBI3295320.1 DMT family transporter [Deltaproteobacteria bacterium]
MVGTIGVGFVARAPEAELTTAFILSITACLTAALCYALAGVYIKRRCIGVKSKAIAGASQLLGGIALLPLIVVNGLPIPIALTPTIVMNVIGLSLLCSAVAYLLYYRLIADIGPTRALTVTFLMPAFGMLWAVLFAGETVTDSMLVGTILIISGTTLVLGLKWR